MPFLRFIYNNFLYDHLTFYGHIYIYNPKDEEKNKHTNSYFFIMSFLFFISKRYLS